MNITVFWDVSPCGVVNRFFRETRYLLRQVSTENTRRHIPEGSNLQLQIALSLCILVS
jgi:hypothetical protein